VVGVVGTPLPVLYAGVRLEQLSTMNANGAFIVASEICQNCRGAMFMTQSSTAESNPNRCTSKRRINVEGFTEVSKFCCQTRPVSAVRVDNYGDPSWRRTKTVATGRSRAVGSIPQELVKDC